MTRNRISKAIAVCSLLFVAGIHHGFSAGVTFITHGLNGNANGWVSGMAERIPEYPLFPGTNYSIYKVYFYPSGGSGYSLAAVLESGVSPTSSDSGEIIIKFDWSQFDNGDSYDTYQMAAIAETMFLDTNFIAELGGHALAEYPIHLIGHSRGGSLICELSKRLGARGIWVDHVTTLDPHPLNNDGFDLDAVLYSDEDAPARTYENVLFHDNYWQDNATVVYGEPVAGAYVRKLTDTSGGYDNIGDSHYPHSNVHLFYHGTIDLRDPANDTEASLSHADRQKWYVAAEEEGTLTGFYFSLIGGFDRTSMWRPLGSGHPMIRSGYNQIWDLGAGVSNNRTRIPTNSGEWPSIISVKRLDTNDIAEGSSNGIDLYYQWAKTAGTNGQLALYIDDDLNPFNGNEVLITNFTIAPTGPNAVGHISPVLQIPDGVTGQPFRSILAVISGDGEARFFYATQPIQTASPVSNLNLAKAYNGLIYDDASGVTVQSSGLIALTTTPLDSYSAVVSLAGRRYSFTGQFDASGFSTNTVRNSKKQPVFNLTLQAENTNGTNIIFGRIEGSNWTASVLADASYSASPGGQSPAGQFTFSILDTQSSAAPAGDGFAIVKIDKKGRLKMSGTLADGTKISQSTMISQTLTNWPLYVSLYGNKGLLVGWVTVPGSTVAVSSNAVFWVKPQSSRAEGFSVETAIIGSQYDKSIKAADAMTTTNLLTVASALPDPSMTITNSAALVSRAVIKSTGGLPASFVFSQSSGIVSGHAVIEAGGRPATFRGVLLQSAAIIRGYYKISDDAGELTILPDNH
jgi:hypothetical protein